MALRISLGQYYDADSIVHRLDPRTKVVGAIAIMVSAFFIQSPCELVLGFAITLGLVVVAHVPARNVLTSIKPVVFMLALLSLFNLFMTTDGTTIARLWFLRITTSGVRSAVLYSLRLVIGVLAATLMLLTTTPAQLTDAFDALLAPLARFGLPAHELAMVFSLMLRFIPTLADEAGAIMDAQKARGGALGEGSPLKRVRAIIPIIVSLLVSSIHHANDLSRALDARCYEGGAGRSHWHPLRMHARDAGALVVVTLYVMLIVFDLSPM